MGSRKDAGKLWKRNLSEKVLLALFDYTISSMCGRIVFCFLRNCEAFATKWWIASFFWYFQYIPFFRSHAWNTEKILMSNGAASPNWLLENFKENLKEAEGIFKGVHSMIGIAGRAGGRCSYVLTKRLDKAYKINYCIKEIRQ